MHSNRIQKLLFNEYSDFEEIVLLESPFTETTKDGLGLRQVQMGITTTKLILATDILKSYDDRASFAYCLEAGRIGIDPEIESLELVSLFPVEVVNLSVYRKKNRHTLKAHFCNDTVLFFELSGSEKRNMFWNLWLERIHFLSPDNAHSHSSFPSSCGGSTSSTSTLYIVGSQLNVKKPGQAQLFCYYNYEPDISFSKRIGNFKNDLETGKLMNTSLCENTGHYADTSSSSPSKLVSNLRHKKQVAHKLDYENRRKSSASLYETFLSEESLGDVVRHHSFSQFDMSQYSCELSSSEFESLDMYELIESSIQMWERNLKGKKHMRRYGLATKPHFLHGLGPWKLSKGDTYSVQIKRSVSLVNIQRQPFDKSLHVKVSKRQLTHTISCEALHVMPELNPSFCTDSKLLSPTSPVVFFWTTNYWYRPQSASAAYGELQGHLKELKNMLDKRNQRKKRVVKKIVKGGRSSLKRSDVKLIEAVKTGTEKMRTLSSTSCSINSDPQFCVCDRDRESSTVVIMENRNVRTRQAAGRGNIKYKDPVPINLRTKPSNKCSTCPVSFLRQLLKPKRNYTIWDFPSQTLAHQLTMIDKNLFLRVSVQELGALMMQQCSRNAPNISAIIAFSHRISCLVTTEILKEKTVALRARAITRFIEIADVCIRWRNFHSTQSVLYGLCSPPIYRLLQTWAYMRKHHAINYSRMVELCQQFRDPRLPTSQLIFTDGHATPPFLPSISHVMVVLLNRMEDYPDELLKKHCSKAITRKRETYQALQAHNQRKSVPNSLRRIFSAFRFMPDENNHAAVEENCRKLPDEPRGSNTQSCESASIESKLNEFISPIVDKFESNDKLRQLEVVCLSLLHWQRAAMMFNFKGSEDAIEYLLKARYQEERENFRISLSLEQN